jgi:hypothetical protein
VAEKRTFRALSVRTVEGEPSHSPFRAVLYG